MVQALKYGLMELSTKVNGETTKQTAKASFGMLTVTSMKATGKMTRPMVKEYMYMLMVQDTKDSGKMTYKTATV